MMIRLAACVLPAVFLSTSIACAQQPQTFDRVVQAASSTSSNASGVAPGTSRATQEMRGDIFMARKMYPEAIHAYELILVTVPNDATLLNKIGVAYQQDAEIATAGRYYKRAMKANKTYSSAINNLGTIEYEKKHYGKAIHLYKQAMVLKPANEMGTLYSNLGYAYFADKEFPQALDCFEKALAIDPDVFGHHTGYGSTIQQRSTTDPGLFNFMVAKTFAKQGDIERCAHYLKMARDDGYKKMADVQTDPEFARVIKDPRVQEVLQTTPSFAGDSQKPQPPQQ